MQNVCKGLKIYLQFAIKCELNFQTHFPCILTFIKFILVSSFKWFSQIYFSKLTHYHLLQSITDIILKIQKRYFPYLKIICRTIWQIKPYFLIINTFVVCVSPTDKCFNFCVIFLINNAFSIKECITIKKSNLKCSNNRKKYPYRQIFLSLY